MASGKLRVLTTPEAASYDIPGHPEHPRRVLHSIQHLQNILPSGVFSAPPPASLDQIARVHYQSVIQAVESESYIDPDTPGASGVFRASLLSAGAAVQAAEEALKGYSAFSLMRPPGHHATPDQSMGFCYFNSIAVAGEEMVHRGKAKRIAFFDLDCHHGNGTEDFCFGKNGFLYVSLHQFPAYPGTGRSSRGNCLNYPLPPGTVAGHYFPFMEQAMGRIRDFKPDLIAVSMGFDTYEKDPLTDFGLTKEDYRQMGQMLRSMKVPMFSLLEGGYHDDLPFLIEAYLEGWTT